MKNTEPNKILKQICKELKQIEKLYTAEGANTQFWTKQTELKNRLHALVNVVGAVEVMSKNSIIKLVALQSSLRFIPEHRFYMAFSRAAEDMEL